MFITKTKSCSLTKVCCIKNRVVIDSACGSGSLLLKFSKVLGKENVKQDFYGKEINLTSYNLSRINMFLHYINYNKFNFERGDTLKHPANWDDESFNAIVYNPPETSLNWDGIFFARIYKDLQRIESVRFVLGTIWVRYF